MQKTRKKKAATATPAFQVYPGDELGDRRKAILTDREFGCYWKLTLYCWKACGLPNDISELAGLCHQDAQTMSEIWKKLAIFFKQDAKDPSQLIHEGNQLERLKQARHKAAKRLGSQKGGASTKEKWAALRGKALRPAEGLVSPRRDQALSSSSSSSSSPSESLSPNPSLGEERESEAISEPENRILLRAEIGSIFKRPPSRKWSKPELVALEALGEITPEEVSKIKRYYAVKIDEAKDRRRHSLRNLLENWAGELDGAEIHARTEQTRKFKL